MIVHLGLRGFARAHLGEYTEDAGGWEIRGVAPRSSPATVLSLDNLPGNGQLLARDWRARFAADGAGATLSHSS